MKTAQSKKDKFNRMILDSPGIWECLFQKKLE